MNCTYCLFSSSTISQVFVPTKSPHFKNGLYGYAYLCSSQVSPGRTCLRSHKFCAIAILIDMQIMEKSLVETDPEVAEIMVYALLILAAAIIQGR